jgi:type 1 fimbriae regulatory protein FimB
MSEIIESAIPKKIQYTSSPDKIKYLTQPQLSELFKAVKKIGSIRDTAIILLSYYHGLRISEVGKLQLSDYDEESKRIRLRRAKGGLGYTYKIADEVLQALKKWLIIRGNAPGPLFPSRKSTIAENERGISKRQLHDLFIRYATEAGIPESHRHFHVLRHSIAVYMIEKDIPMRKIQDWLGHRSIQSTEVYAKVSDMARDETAELLYESGKKEDKVRIDWRKDKRK